MNVDHRKYAEMLSEDVSELQKRVLVKHTTALLEALQDVIRSEQRDARLAEGFADDYRRERDECIEVLRTIYAERGEDERISELCNGILERFTSSA